MHPKSIDVVAGPPLDLIMLSLFYGGNAEEFIEKRLELTFRLAGGYVFRGSVDAAARVDQRSTQGWRLKVYGTISYDGESWKTGAFDIVYSLRWPRSGRFWLET